MNVSRLLFVLLILLVVCSFLAEGGKKNGKKKKKNRKKGGKKNGGKKNGGDKKTGNGKDNLTDMMAGCKFILLFCTSLMTLIMRTPFICSPFISYNRIGCETWGFVTVDDIITVGP